MSSYPDNSKIDISQLVLEETPSNEQFGIVRGIVVQNNDPERRGRVKIFIPSLQPQIFKKWIENISKDKSFRFVGGSNIYIDCNTGNGIMSLKDILDESKSILPWSDQASALIGGGSAGMYDYNADKATISTGSEEAGRLPKENACKQTPAEDSQNVDNISESGGHKYETPAFQLQDGFANAVDDKMPIVNAYSKLYKPSTYSNTVGGIFNIPNVGATVWCFFENNNKYTPIYFAFSYSITDWHKIYEQKANPDFQNPGVHYPAAAENYKDDIHTKSGKIVLNSKGGSIEIIDTDQFESVKLTQADGSFMQMNKTANVELAVGNAQKLVKGDTFDTTEGNLNIRTKKTMNIGVDETRWARTGTWNVDAFAKWCNLNYPVADTRALFPIMRTEAYIGSTLQKKSGIHGPNTVLNQSTPTVTSPAVPSDIYTDTPAAKTTGNDVEDRSKLVPPVKENSSKRSKLALSTQTFIQAAGPTGSNNFSGNPALSNSSEAGAWGTDPNYTALSELELGQSEEMLQYENEFGTGGDDIEEVTRHKVCIVGAHINDTPSVRVDPVGRTKANEVLVSTGGAFTSQKPSHHVERVANDGKFPCGNYCIIINNKFSVTAGSGGIAIQTSGCVDISGSLLTMSGAEEVVISSSGDIALKSASSISIEADIITLKQKDNKQVVVDCSLGVTNNVTVAGGVYVEGELFVQHITGPAEVQETEEVVLYSTPNNMRKMVIGFTKDKDGNWQDVYSCVPEAGKFPDNDCITGASHTHNFLNLPISLKADNTTVRSAAQSINKGNVQVAAHSLSHTKHSAEQA
jgi:hypothetical protein